MIGGVDCSKLTEDYGKAENLSCLKIIFFHMKELHIAHKIKS